ncbi:hypothetical protein EV426DRAFT_623713 [Tirmania nivea]|nr:hypothetical protein EV426DRAFT_623713 [Tirmania nivea]
MKLCQPLLSRFFAAAALILLVIYSMDLYIYTIQTSRQPNNTFSNSALITDPPPIICWHRCPYFWIEGSSTT